MARTVGIGHQDFEALRKKGNFYVGGYWKETGAFTRSLFHSTFKYGFAFEGRNLLIGEA